ncbi:S8 family serine peptidase [Hyphomicrobium sp.]|uniref:S8 family serine peptidase n=1 Tax=Hyphomicrobium sp. TaxID=82 RepID=UPI002E2F95F6|nr:S8 family serine peptidase [Hyphomicrobium sp.]HEX2842600.1 S8 family serine peptidase [Hyphomicrobium sp.]
MMSVRGEHLTLAHLGRALQLVLVALLVVSLGASDVLAKKNRKNRNPYFQNFEREMARQREEQQRELQKAQRAAEQAQREAERMARQQPDRSMRDSQRDRDDNPWGQNRDSTKRANLQDRDDDKDRGDTPGRRRDADQNGNEDVADLDEGDFDPGVSGDVQRRVRAIERMRLRLQRDQDTLRQKEQAREERLRKWAEQDKDRPGPDRNPDGPRNGQAAGEGKDKPAVVPVSVSRDEGAEDDGKSRRVKWLDGLQNQASHLGMGRNALKGISEQARGDDATEGAEAPAPQGGAAIEPGKAAKDDARRNRVEREAAVEARRTRSFPGADKGAELPAKQFNEEREEELIVNELSPVDIETAKSHGFAVGPTTVLPGSGKKVQRLSAPGVGRDEAERELHKVMPFLSVTPNYAYNIFIGSLGETEGAAALPGLDRRKVAPASSQPCSDNNCFGSHLIKWKEALSPCTKDVRIGVIDTSFDIGHPAFKSVNAIQGEFLDGERPSPYDWHGTAVLSVLAGNPHSGTPGLIPDATFLLATAFRSDAAGNASTDTVRLLAALDWLEQMDVDIVNMSFSGPQDPAFARAIERMSKKGIIFTAAAGNMGPTASPSYPAAYPSVIAVTAVNRNGENYRSANRGTYIDVSAPGVDILTALPDAKQGYRTGTSFAAPFVTAILATRIGEDMPAGGSKSSVLKKLPTYDLGPPGQDPIYGAGLAQAPQQCTGRGNAVASGSGDHGAWSTTFIKAGAGFAP